MGGKPEDSYYTRLKKDIDKKENKSKIIIDDASKYGLIKVVKHHKKTSYGWDY